MKLSSIEVLVEEAEWFPRAAVVYIAVLLSEHHAKSDTPSPDLDERDLVAADLRRSLGLVGRFLCLFTFRQKRIAKLAQRVILAASFGCNEQGIDWRDIGEILGPIDHQDIKVWRRGGSVLKRMIREERPPLAGAKSLKERLK